MCDGSTSEISLPEGVPESIPGSTPETYKVVEGQRLLAHVFTPPGPAPEGGRPGIVFFFGGGWKGGTPLQFRAHCERLAGLGMVAAAADYRVASRARPGFTRWKAIADARSAVRWMRRSAGRLGVDPRRVAAGGGSAGGHLALCAAVLKEGDEPGEDASVSAVPAALVLFNPVADTTRGGYGFSAENEEDSVRWSPVHHVRPGAPPAVVFHGTADTTVPIGNVERLARAWAEAGSECRLHRFEGRRHAFFNYDRANDRPTPDYEETMALAEEFLAHLGWVERP